MREYALAFLVALEGLSAAAAGLSTPSKLMPRTVREVKVVPTEVDFLQAAGPSNFRMTHPSRPLPFGTASSL